MQKNIEEENKQRNIEKENRQILQGISLRDLLEDTGLSAIEKFYFLCILDIEEREKPTLEKLYFSPHPNMVPTPYRAFERYGLTGQGRILVYNDHLIQGGWIGLIDRMRYIPRGHKLTGMQVNRNRALAVSPAQTTEPE